MINIDVNTSTHRQTEHNTSVITTDVTNDTDNNSPTLAVCPCRLLTFLLAATSHICVKPLYVPTAIKLPCQTKSTMLPYSPSICNMFSLQMCNDNSTQFNNTQLQKNLIRQYYRIQSCIFNQLQF